LQEQEEDKPPIELETLSSPPQPPEVPASDPRALQLDGSPAYVPPPAPPRDPVWSGWDVVLIALLAIGSLILSQVILLLMARFWIFPHATVADLAKKPTLALLSMLLSYGAIGFYMVRLVRTRYHSSFLPAIRWNFPASWWRFPLLGLALMLVLASLQRFLPMPKDAPFEQFFAHPFEAYLTSIFAVTLGPVMEELFFRGFVYPVLVRRTAVTPAILLTSVLFGLLHSMQLGYAWGGVLVIVLVGLVLTSVRAATNSVAASLLVHIGYNGALMLIAAVQTDGFRHMEKAALLCR
jgi:membrane protease YdiL (CAAX protease family)